MRARAEMWDVLSASTSAASLDPKRSSAVKSTQVMEYVPQIDAPALYPVQTFVPIELGSVSADAVEPINAP